MATYEHSVALPRTRSARLVHMVSRTPLHIALLTIGVVWLVTLRSLTGLYVGQRTDRPRAARYQDSLV